VTNSAPTEKPTPALKSRKVVIDEERKTTGQERERSQS